MPGRSEPAAPLRLYLRRLADGRLPGPAPRVLREKPGEPWPGDGEQPLDGAFRPICTLTRGWASSTGMLLGHARGRPGTTARSVTFDPRPDVKHFLSAGLLGALGRQEGQGSALYRHRVAVHVTPTTTAADGRAGDGHGLRLQQGWSALEFSYSHTDVGDFDTFNGKLFNFFDVMYQPVWMALWPAVATLVQRGDLAPLGAAGPTHPSRPSSWPIPRSPGRAPARRRGRRAHGGDAGALDGHHARGRAGRAHPGRLGGGGQRPDPAQPGQGPVGDGRAAGRRGRRARRARPVRWTPARCGWTCATPTAWCWR